MREGLTPKGREFFDLMKEGRVLGAYESDFKEHFKDVVLKQFLEIGNSIFFRLSVVRKITKENPSSR